MYKLIPNYIFIGVLTQPKGNENTYSMVPHNNFIRILTHAKLNIIIHIDANCIYNNTER